MIRTRLTIWNAVVLALVLTLIGSIVYATMRSILYGPIDANLTRWTNDLAKNIGRDWDNPRRMPPPDGERRGGGPMMLLQPNVQADLDLTDRQKTKLEALLKSMRPPGGRPPNRGPGRPGPMGFGGGPPPGGMNELPPPPPEGAMPSPREGVSPEQERRMRFEWFVSGPRVITAEGKGFRYATDRPWDEESMKRSLRGEHVFSYATVMDERIRVLSVPISSKGKVVGVVQSASLLTSTDELMGKLSRTLLALLPLALLLTSLTGVFLTRFALRPVQRIAEAAERIEATNLSGRLPVRGKDEFAILSTTINSMLSRLESSFQQLAEAYESQRRFISDASHELKTPLTAIKTRVGVAKRGTQTPERYQEHLLAIGVSADSMTAIVQDLLLLARSDEGRLDLKRSSVPLLALADEASMLVRGPGKARLELDVPSELDVCVDQTLFTRVLINLLGNALRHTPADGLVRLTARTQGERVVIEVVDTGEGIPPEHVTQVFERFHRVDVSRDKESGGTGLGLPIAKSVVEAHGGTISLSSELGKGTTVRIVL